VADDVDISGMPPPPALGTSPAAQSDPTTDMPAPEDLYRKFYFGGGAPNAQGKLGPIDPIPQDALDDFMAHPPHTPTARETASRLTGLPRIAATWNPVTPVVAAVAGGAGALSGALGAAGEYAVGDPATASKRASEDLQTGRQRMRDWAGGVYGWANKIPATEAGAKLADYANSIPGQVAKHVNDTVVRPTFGDNAADTVGDVVQDVATLAPAAGVRGVARGAAGAVKGAARAAKDLYKSEASTVTAPNAEPTPPDLKPNVGTPVSGDSLRAAPNPIPPPAGTVAHANAAAAAPAAPLAETGNAPVAAPTENAAPAASPSAAPKPNLPETDAAPQDMSLSPDQRAIVREGVAARRRATDERGSVRLFNSPADEGPQETPAPDQQSERVGHLDDLDRLSSGGLPTRRTSALTGDYNATGDDYQMKEVGNEQMRTQLASENAALHTAADTVHNSIGSEFENSVDSQTLGDRGRVTRGAIQGIEKHFDDATDGIYDAARTANQGRQIPKLQRVHAYLNDDSNFTNDAEIGLQRAAKQRLDRLWTTGDPDKGTPPGSVNAAERFREFLNEKGKNPQAMGVANDLKNHTDMDVAEHGGPGLFQAARAMRRHSYQMLEEPVGIKKLLTPGDSQGINHAIPEHKVMDYIADLPREQHEHVLNVLRAGAHLGKGELAERSATAIKEIQAHVVSRMHAAATNADGTWNARKFYAAADRYARNAQETFKDRPDVLDNLKTINNAGNTLHMDKHYPGAAAQTERTGTVGHILEAGGNIVSGLAHDVPVIGRLVGRAMERGVEGLGGKISESTRDKIVAKRIVGRDGKQRGSVQAMPSEEELHKLNLNTPPSILHQLTPEQIPAHVEQLKSHLAQRLDDKARGYTNASNSKVINKLTRELAFFDKQRGAVGDLNQRDAVTHKSAEREDGTVSHLYGVPDKGGGLGATEYPERGVTQVMTSNVNDKGKGWGTRMLQRVADDAHARGQVLHSDQKVSHGQAGAYKNLAQLGYDVKMKPHDNVQGDYKAHGDHVFEVRPPTDGGGGGSRLNIGLYQGAEGSPNFRKMSKQEAAGAVESTGATVTKSSVLTPDAHGVSEPTLVASTNRPLSEPEMQSVLTKTKQSAIPQRTDAGVESMHVAPGHEEIAKKEGWDKFDPNQFRGHPDERGSVRVMNEKPAERRNERSEYNANGQLAGERKLTPEQQDVLRRLSGERGSVRVMNEKPLAGAPEGDRPNAIARTAAAAYAKKAGIDYQPLKDYRYLYPKAAKNVADAYEAMKHDPTDPKVAKSYAAFKAETLAQYKQMQKAGVKVDLDPSYPYKNPREMHTDVRDNNHMSIYPTEAGFGSSDAAPTDHPLMEKSPIQMGGKDATYNDLFRAVHDYYGHAAEGNGFRANGEYNAWRAHRQMYSNEARGAMDAETLGQNSWVNSGPAAALNKGASGADTIYADQKAGLLPKDVVKAAEGGVDASEHHVTNQLTDQERGQLRNDTTKRLVDAFNGAPAAHEYAAAALAGAAKRGWYRNSAQAITNQFGHEAPRFAALLSAMSPQVSVQTNFANALKTYVNWDKAGRPENPDMIRAIMEDSSQRSANNPGRSNVLDAWVNNSVRALTAEDPSKVQLSGPKVHSFYNNLTDNVNEVTNDAWMAAFAKIDPAKLGGTLNKSGPGKSPTYLALSGKVREAARMISHLTGETWTPAEVQETVWSWAKTAYEHAEEKGDRSIPDLVKNGDITDELIKSTPDFHQLFSTSEHRGLLQSSRFAGDAEQLAEWKKQGADTAGASQARAAAQQALRPHLISAAERLEQLRQERRASGKTAPKEE
jgi:hypothetical protein